MNRFYLYKEITNYKEITKFHLRLEESKSGDTEIGGQPLHVMLGQ